MVERLLYTQDVAGSIPASGISFMEDAEDIFLTNLSNQVFDKTGAEIWAKVWSMTDLLPIYIDYIFQNQVRYGIESGD